MTVRNLSANRRSPRRSTRCSRSRPLNLERLEGRCLLSYTVTELGPATEAIFAYGINNAGQVVGQWGNHGFLSDHGAVTDLGTLPGGMYSGAFAINNLGQVAGYADLPVSNSRAFVWDQGVMTDLGTLGGLRAAAWGINDAGQVAGGADLTDQFYGPGHAFRWEGGTMTDLGTLGGPSSNAYGINNAGDVVGWALLPDYSTHAFLYDDGVMSDLGAPPGHTATTAYAINNADQVVGTADFDPYPQDPYTHAVLWQDGTLTDLGTLGGPSSEAFAINDAGDVVGETQLAGGPPYRSVAFLYHHGVMTDLNTLLVPGSGLTIVSARGINDAGQIIGFGEGGPQFQDAVLLTPTRDPPQGQPLPDPVAVQGLAVPLPPGGLGSAPSPADGQPVPNPPAAEIPAGRVLRDPSPTGGAPAVATLRQEVNVSPWVGDLGESATAGEDLLAFPG